MTEGLITSAVPVFKVEGEVHGELARDVHSVETEETTEGLKTCHACFIAFGPSLDGGQEERIQYLDGTVFDFGKELEVVIGPDQNSRIVFRGKISAIEANFKQGREPRVSVYAEDSLMDFRMTRRMKTYENVTDTDIVQEIAAEHGLSAEVDADGPTYDRIQQWNMSDLAFIRERARLIRAEVWIAGGILHFKTRKRRSAPQLTLVQDNHILSLQVRADCAHQRTKVKVSGYDASSREVIDEEADESVIRSEVGNGGVSGPAVLSRSFGDRESFRVREVPLNSDEARAYAEAEMRRRGRAFVTATGITSGSPDMVVGSLLTLERIGTPFEGEGYYTTRVCHRYDQVEGFRTRFTAERATINSAAGVGGT